VTAVRVAIRPAGVADASAVTACQTACWRETYGGLVPADHLSLVSVEQPRVFLADAAGEVVGVVSAGPSRDDPKVYGPEPAEELMGLYLLAAWRGTGVADRLLAVAVADRPASLWVFAAGARAQAFYRRHGFRPDCHRTVDSDTGLDQIRMVRR